MRQAIMGAGSLGTILGALLTSKGIQVDMVDVWDEHVKALNEKGATITGKINQTVKNVTALKPDQMEGLYDIVYLLTKSVNDNVVLPKIKQHLSADGVVVVMQNGLPEDRVAAVIGPDRVVGCPIGWGATLQGPGVSELTTDTDKMTFDLGELDGVDRPRLNLLAEILNNAGIAHKTNNLIGIRWTKLIANATLSGMSAALGCTFGDILDNPTALYYTSHIMKEAIEIVNAAGVIPEPIQGADVRFLYFKTREEYLQKEPIMQLIYKPHRELIASMLQDIRKGQPCEIDSINGAMAEWAKKYEVPSPVNDQVVALIRSHDSGQTKPDMKYLDSIVVPELD